VPAVSSCGHTSHLNVKLAPLWHNFCVISVRVYCDTFLDTMKSKFVHQ